MVICWERSKFWAKLSDPLASFEEGVSGGIVNMARGEYALINLPQFFNPSLPAPVVIHSVPQPAIQPPYHPRNPEHKTAVPEWMIVSPTAHMFILVTSVR